MIILNFLLKMTQVDYDKYQFCKYCYQVSAKYAQEGISSKREEGLKPTSRGHFQCYAACCSLSMLKD